MNSTTGLEVGDIVICIDNTVLKQHLGDAAPEVGLEYTVDEVFDNHILLSEIHGKKAMCSIYFIKVRTGVISNLLKGYLKSTVQERSDCERVFVTNAAF